jgi:hypothetical protein
MATRSTAVATGASSSELDWLSRAPETSRSGQGEPRAPHHAARLDFKKEGRTVTRLATANDRSKACARAAVILQTRSARPAVATAIPGRPRSGLTCRGSADKARYVKAALPARPLPPHRPRKGRADAQLQASAPWPLLAPRRSGAPLLPGPGAPVHNAALSAAPRHRPSPTGAAPGLPATAGPTPRASSGLALRPQCPPAPPRPRARPSRTPGLKRKTPSLKRFAGWPAARLAATPFATPHARPEPRAPNSHKTGRLQARPKSRTSIVGHPGALRDRLFR